jgi:uncharacterized protein (DUF433 family)
VFAGSTIPLQVLLDHLRLGGSLDAFVDQHPEITREQALAVCAFALEDLIARERIPVGPPQGSLLPRCDDHGVITNAAELGAYQVVGRKVLCPSCRELVFQVWPEGWDSHAEHRCAGITATDAMARKTEFKQRYQHLFK